MCLYWNSACSWCLFLETKGAPIGGKTLFMNLNPKEHSGKASLQGVQNQTQTSSQRMW